MDIRERLLDVTAELLAASPSPEVSTAAICAAAGVDEKLIAEHFTDTAGLLAAVVEDAYRWYLTSREANVWSADPMADLRTAWDNQIDFATASPNAYRLLFASPATAVPAAVEESFQLLRELLSRCAAVGRLRISVPVAAQIVMAANVGAALSRITRSEQYPDETVSVRLRDAVHASVITPEAVRTSVSSVDEAGWDDAWADQEPEAEDEAAEVVIASPPTGMLAVQVQRNWPNALSEAEADALQATLDRAASSE